MNKYVWVTQEIGGVWYLGLAYGNNPAVIIGNTRFKNLKEVKDVLRKSKIQEFPE